MSDRKEELLAAARDRLTAEKQARANGAAPSNGAPEIRYRGQVLRSSATGVPGGGSARAATGPSDDVRAALEQVKALYNDGLISRAEAERKRSEILGRL